MSLFQNGIQFSEKQKYLSSAVSIQLRLASACGGMVFQTQLVLYCLSCFTVSDGKVSRRVSNRRLSRCKQLCHSLQFGGTEPPTCSNPFLNWYTEYLRLLQLMTLTKVHSVGWKSVGSVGKEILRLKNFTFSFSFQIDVDLN